MIGATVGEIGSRIADRLVGDVVGRISTEEKRLFLTIDDGPSGMTEEMIEIATEHDSSATWFIVGQLSKSNRRVVSLITASGNTVGNHSFRHLDAWKSRWTSVHMDLELGLAEAEEATGAPCRLTRPPYGRIRPKTLSWCRLRQQTPILWDVMAPDYRPHVDAETVAEHVRSKVRPGSILVMHDRDTAAHRDAFRMTVSVLRQDGWQISSLPVRS